MTAFKDRPVSVAAAAISTALLLAYTVAWMVAAALHRGIWIDEVWSLWMSQHDIPLAAVVAQRWSHDVHPFFFHAMNWVLEPTLGMNVYTRRLLNLVPLAFFLASATYLALRNPRARSFVIVFLTIVIASPYSVRYFAEHRSYFSGLCFTGSLMTCLYCLCTDEGDFNLKRHLDLAVLLCASAIFALDIHYVGTVIVGSVLGVAALDQLRRGHLVWTSLLIVSGAVGVALLLPILTLESPYLKVAGASFWIKTSPVVAAVTLSSTIALTWLENLVAGLIAGLVLLATTQGGGRAFNVAIEPPDRKAWSFVAVAVAALVVAFGTLFIINSIKPVVVSRYLIPLVPISAAPIAAMVANQLLKRRWIFAAFLLNAAIVGAVEAEFPLHEARWEGTARQIEAQVKSCPATRVYALAPEFFSSFTGPPNQPMIHEWGYQSVAANDGFRATLLNPGSPQPIELAAGCPTVFWGEHINRYVGPAELIKAPFTMFLPSGVDLASAKLFRDEDGFTLSLTAPAPSPSLTAKVGQSPGRIVQPQNQPRL